MESTNQPYLLPEVQPSRPLVSDEHISDQPVLLVSKRERELSPLRIFVHVLLLVVTAITTTLTAAAFSAPLQAEPDSFMEALFGPVLAVFTATASGDYSPLLNGLLFSATLLVILGAHELGHYFACRYYGIRATLPFFIPAPPALTPFGTFGAVIKIKEPITTRRALFDIGIAGPLAGFMLALPASIVGLLIAKEALPPAAGQSGLYYNDPLLFKIVMQAFGLPQWIEWNPIYWAAWGTLLVTALNLFPVGQLDGGHVVYAVFGRRLHRWVSVITAASVTALAIVSMVFYSSPIWFIWTLVLLFLLKAGHPPVIEDEPLGGARIALAVVAVVVFLLCFMPFPITIY